MYEGPHIRCSRKKSLFYLQYFACETIEFLNNLCKLSLGYYANSENFNTIPFFSNVLCSIQIDFWRNEISDSRLIITGEANGASTSKVLACVNQYNSDALNRETHERLKDAYIHTSPCSCYTPLSNGVQHNAIMLKSAENDTTDFYMLVGDARVSISTLFALLVTVRRQDLLTLHTNLELLSELLSFQTK